MFRVAALLALVSLSLASSGQQPAAWTTPEPPFRIAGPLHYVGTQDLAAYLFATPDGHILLDGATAEGAPLIERSIRALGFKPEDIRILLTSQAHFDHVGSLAYFKRLSHARVEVMRGDDRIIGDGGLSDYLQGPTPTATFEKVTVDRVLSDGDTVSVGGVTLTAKLTPGHTPGSTTWITSVTEGATTYRVVFAGSLTVNPGTRLVERPSYPGILEDYRRSITILSSLEPDIFLGAHTSFFNMQAKRKKMTAVAPAEAFVDREGYRRLIAGKRADFEAEVARQKR